MLILVFDTETDGLFPKNSVIDAENYINLPNMLQLSWIMYNTKTKEQVEMDFIFTSPRGIPSEITKINHLDDNICDNGYNVSDVIGIFLKCVKKCDLIVFHNGQFDLNILELELYRLNRERDADMIFSKPFYDTMLKAKDVLKIPSKYKNNFKFPSLAETYKYFFNKEIIGAHNALIDCRITLEIYKKLNKLL